MYLEVFCKIFDISILLSPGALLSECLGSASQDTSPGMPSIRRGSLPGFGFTPVHQVFFIYFSLQPNRLNPWHIANYQE